MNVERRVGIGYDAHPFAAERELVLGGVRIAGEPGLAGHSDADLVSHAVLDALLGAAGEGDIGERFPDQDPHYRDADSIELLAEVVAALGEPGWRVVNVDVTVVAERPRIAPFRQEMAGRLSGALRVGTGRVSVKATTNEGMGFIGRGEGMAAIAVAQIERAAKASSASGRVAGGAAAAAPAAPSPE
jgi:2-C-methyl-D-erythritol 2,4-cyclodiphosphate synthase